MARGASNPQNFSVATTPQQQDEDPTYFLEKVSISETNSDDEAQFAYEEVNVVDSDDEYLDDDDTHEDLETALRNLKANGARIPTSHKLQRFSSQNHGGAQQARNFSPSIYSPNTNQQTTSNSNNNVNEVQIRPSSVDDFIRNFLVKMKLGRTLEVFQTEWYELMHRGLLEDENKGTTPDVYLLNQELDDKIKSLREELENYKSLSQRATEQCSKLKKDGEFHRIHHKRVAQEKNKMLMDIKKLQQRLAEAGEEILTLKGKTESQYKELALAKLERERLNKRIAELESESGMAVGSPIAMDTTRSKQQRTPIGKERGRSREREDKGKSRNGTLKRLQPLSTSTPPKDETPLPQEDRVNPWLDITIEPPTNIAYATLLKTQVAHPMAISSLTMHPTKPIVVTVSDDTLWRMWNLPDAQLIMSGDGHKNWVSDCDFHPKGTHLVTSSGDSTVKIWDFAQGCCSLTLLEHTQAVWSVAFHDTGDFAVSGSLDHTAKLWDLNTGRCRQTLRGHMDSINSVTFMPYTNVVATCSGDKTVSLWDVRSGLCQQTLYGHLNSCNHVAFDKRGDLFLSTDADGGLKLWDIRTVSERCGISVGPFPANKATFDLSGNYVIIPSDDSSLKIYGISEGKILSELKGHEDAVHAAAFEPSGKYLTSAGSDGALKIWTFPK